VHFVQHFLNLHPIFFRF